MECPSCHRPMDESKKFYLCSHCRKSIPKKRPSLKKLWRKLELFLEKLYTLVYIPVESINELEKDLE